MVITEVHVGGDNDKNGETCGVDVALPSCSRVRLASVLARVLARACHVRGRHHDGECEDEKVR